MGFDFDRIAEEFDSTRSFDPRLVESVSDAICRLLGAKASLLDIGSGTGRFLLPISRRGISAFGIDLSKNMLLKARDKGLANLVRADASKLPFRDSQFDASFLSGVLHLMGAWKEAVREACRVSRRAVISLDPGRNRDDNPHDIFKSVMMEKRFEIPRKGPYETELCADCAPERRIALPPFVETKRKSDLLAAFRKRTFTYQSNLTADQNMECLKELERRLPGERIDIRWEPTLIVWDPQRLSQDVSKTTFCYPH